MVNQYSRNFCICCNNPINRLAATALEHNLQYSNYRRNIWSSNYRRNGPSKINFKHNMTSLQPFFIPRRTDCSNGRRITWQDGTWGNQRLNNYGGGRSRNKQHSKLYTRVLDERNNNPKFAQTNFNNSNWNHNHCDIRQQLPIRVHNNRNGYIVRQPNIPSHANKHNLNNNRNREHRIRDSAQHDWNGNLHNPMEVVDVSKDDEETECDITEATGTPNNTHGNRNWCNQPLESNDPEDDLAESSQISDGSPTYSHGNWKWRNVESNNDSEEDLTANSQISDGSPIYSHGNGKWRDVESNNDSEEDLTANLQISDGSLNYVHSNFNCHDQSRGCSDSEDLDVHSEISDTICRQDIEITTLQEESDPTIHDLENLAEQTETEDESILLPDNTSDERTENTPPTENDRSTLYVFRTKNPDSETYRLYICLPLDEGNWVAIGHQDNLRVENLADDWIQDNVGEDENQDDAGLSEEAISEQLQSRIYSKYANKGNWEADGLMDAEEPAVCVICQLHYEDAETLGSLQCGHEYHADCIRKWLVQKNNCPICKYTVLVEDET